MFKVIALLTRKPGLTRDEFVDYYENNHAPLITETFPQIIEYRRNFPDLTQVLRTGDTPDPQFDVITEMWFSDKSGYEDMLATHAQPEVGNRIRADESNFLDQTRIIQFVVDEREFPRS
ncbi:EthD domain-containing protein [Rhodococcus sp. NPDC059969]|uniref:EthD domain-containing protein n=1 Tax=Rhodococcus sp. NPDC059969 TaxID=3347018 RepID=UPI00366BE775